MRTVLSVLLAVATVVVVPSTARADVRCTDTVNAAGLPVQTCEEHSHPDGGGGSNGSGSGVACTYTPFLPSLPQADYDPGFYDAAGFTGTYDGSSAPLVRTWPDGRVEHAYVQVCPNRPARIVWVDPTITPRELAERALARVVVPRPVPVVSSAPEVGGVVNLGLWLAIEPQPDLFDVETEGAVSVELIGEYQGMHWEFGNDDTVDCADFGVPYEEGANDPGEGPCGYTYEFDENGDEPYTVTVTTTWSFRFTSSSDSGPLGDLTGTAEFDYQVHEIQTVGTGR